MTDLEAAWQWVGMFSSLAIMPVIAMSTLTFGTNNYLDTLAHPIRQFFNSTKGSKKSKKGEPWTIPTWIIVFFFVAVATTYWVGSSLILSNHGAYNGWLVSGNQVSLLLIFTSFAFGNAWWPVYLTSGETCIPGVILPLILTVTAGICAQIKYAQFNVGQSFLLMPWYVFALFIALWVFVKERDCKRNEKENISLPPTV